MKKDMKKAELYNLSANKIFEKKMLKYQVIDTDMVQKLKKILKQKMSNLNNTKKTFFLYYFFII